MVDEYSNAAPAGGGAMKYFLLALAAIYVVLSLFLLVDLRGRVQKLEAGTADSQQKMAKRIGDLESSVKASQQALASKLGMTEEQLQKRTAELQKQQRAAETRLAHEQEQQIGQVTGQIESVKGEVGGVKTDVGAVKSDLETTKGKLERAIGDLGQQSGLIAHTRDDLEFLKHKGDRNYYEFTLNKNQRTPVSTISLQLKKADAKKGKFTLNVIADDRTIEKKDRTLYEPMQFYTGRDRLFYELVVFKVDKDRVSGYLSTPKAYTPPPAQ
jgi:HAMP domain-containing protein